MTWSSACTYTGPISVSINSGSTGAVSADDSKSSRRAISGSGATETLAEYDGAFRWKTRLDMYAAYGQGRCPQRGAGVTRTRMPDLGHVLARVDASVVSAVTAVSCGMTA